MRSIVKLILITIFISCYWNEDLKVNQDYLEVSIARKAHEDFREELNNKQKQLQSEIEEKKTTEVARLKEESAQISNELFSGKGELKDNPGQQGYEFTIYVRRYYNHYDVLSKIDDNAAIEEYLKKFDEYTFIFNFTKSYRFIDAYSERFKRDNGSINLFIELAHTGGSYKDVMHKKEKIMEKLLKRFPYIDLKKFNFNPKDWN